MTDDRQEWWAAHPDVRDVVDAADALVLAACARDIGHTAVEVPRYEVREHPLPAGSAALQRVIDTMDARSDVWPSEVNVPDACVARVTSPDGHKRTAVVVVLRRGRTERAIVVDTEAP